MIGQKETAADRLRKARREQFWPGSGDEVWKGVKEKGWFASPRTLPLICTLIREKTVCGTVDASSVYQELVHRDMGQGLVEILDESEHAYAAGYTSQRSVRSWRERMRELAAAGFIKIYPKPTRDIGFVIIPHPHKVITKLHADGKVPDRWWQLYCDRLRQIGGEPEPVAAPAPTKGLKVIPGSGGAQRPKQRTVAARARQRRG